MNDCLFLKSPFCSVFHWNKFFGDTSERMVSDGE